MDKTSSKSERELQLRSAIDNALTENYGKDSVIPYRLIFRYPEKKFMVILPDHDVSMEIADFLMGFVAGIQTTLPATDTTEEMEKEIVRYELRLAHEMYTSHRDRFDLLMGKVGSKLFSDINDMRTDLLGMKTAVETILAMKEENNE